MQVASFKVKMLIRGRIRVSIQVFDYKSSVHSISFSNTLSLAFCQYTSIFIPHPFQEFSGNLPHPGVCHCFLSALYIVGIGSLQIAFYDGNINCNWLIDLW